MNTKNNLAHIKNINTLKTYIILGILFAIIIIFGLIITNLTGNINYLWGAVATSVIMNFTSYFYSDKIALAMSDAIQLERYLANKQLIDKDYIKDNVHIYKNIVKDLSIKNNMPEPMLYIIEDMSPNAFATGRNENNAAIAVTTGLLSVMSTEELRGIIAHELSHIKNKDILIMSVVIVAVSIFSILSQAIMHISSISNNGNNDKPSGILLFFSMVAAITMPIASMIVQASISQKREYMADASGALLAEDNLGLINALKKLASINMPLNKANPATAHLFITNPFGLLESQGFLQKLFMTHPPIEDRIAALENSN